MTDEPKLPIPVSMTWTGLGPGETPVIMIGYRLDDPNLGALLGVGGIVEQPKADE